MSKRAVFFGGMAALLGVVGAEVSNEALDGAMRATDECEAGGGDSACALNEMQLRGIKASSGANPIYCKYLPPSMSSPYCNPSVNTCGCQQYCTASVAPANWGWDPNCCLCGAGVQPTSEIVKPPASAEDELGAGPDVGFQPMAHPIYCAHLPQGVSSPWCSPGVNTCACHQYCTASVQPQNWGWDPNCCGCGGGVPNAPHTHGGGSCAAYGCVGYVKGNSCQCNAECKAHNNCCGDYQAKCAR